jgi:hypothetical protein
VQLTVRVPRVVATSVAIVVAFAAVAVMLPATAVSDTSIVVCIDPATQNLTVNPSCTGSTLSWAQAGVAGAAGATGAQGAAGAAGPAGKDGATTALHLNTSRPSLVARIETTLQVQGDVLTDVNDTVRKGLATTRALAPSADPSVAALQTQVENQAVSINRLVNVLRALSKAQLQLVQGLS